MIVAYAREARNALKRFADMVDDEWLFNMVYPTHSTLSLGVSGLTE